MARSSLKILNWNAHSVASKKLELTMFLKDANIDIAAITETHLKPNISFCLPEHNITRLDRTSAGGGGVAVAVRKGISYKVLPHFNTSFIEAVGIEVVTSTGPIIIAAVYCPKQSRNGDNSATRLRNDLQKLTHRRSKFVLAGDLNARLTSWGCSTSSNNNGRILADDAQHGHYVVAYPDAPTFFSHAGVGSTLDLFLTNIMENISVPEVITALSSDHLPVVMEVGAEVTHHRSTRKNFHRVNWDHFISFIENRIDDDVPIDTHMDIDRNLECFIQLVKDAENMYVPVVPVSSKFTQLDNTTRKLIVLKNTVRRQYQRTLNVRRKFLYKKIVKIIRIRLEKIKNNKFARDLEQLPNYSRPFWRVTKVLKQRPKPIPPLKENDNLLITPFEKANAISQHFQSSHRIGSNIVSPKENIVRESVLNLELAPTDVPAAARITVEEMKNNIKSTRNMKAPGFDGMFNIVLKKLGPKALLLLCKIFNSCLCLSYFPNQWKLAKVIPILKPGKDPTKSSSYRPISLLSSLSKVFERSINTRILEHLDEHNVIPEEQFGFRRGHSTVYQLQRVTNNIKRNKAVSKSTIMAFLDIEKAFDSVWHNGLIHKLVFSQIPTYLVKIISSYLNQRSCRVFLQGTLSDVYNASAGVPQGSILGPILYNIYTSDVPRLPGGGKLSFFADDSAISYSGRVINHLINNLQKGLDCYIDYLTDWKIQVNTTKTQAIVFPHRNSKRLINPPSQIIIRGEIISWSAEVRYLGLTLDKKLLFRQHIDGIVSRSLIILKKLYPLINRRSKLSSTNRLAVYKQIVQPMLLYAAPIWKDCAQTHLRKIQVLQNRYLKMILNLPMRTNTSVVHQMANITKVNDKIHEIDNRFRLAANSSEYQLIRELFV